MGRIMLATSASTDEEYGGTFATQATDITPTGTYAYGITAYKVAKTAVLTMNFGVQTSLSQGTVLASGFPKAVRGTYFNDVYGNLLQIDSSGSLCYVGETKQVNWITGTFAYVHNN